MRNVNRRLNLGLIGLFVLVGLGIAVLMALLPAAAVTTGDAYSGSGDWVVTNPTKVIDEQIYVYGNLEIKGDLTLWNATIFMTLSQDNQYKINVTDTGNLMANDSLLTSAASWIEYGFTVYGEMTLKVVEVSETYDGVRILTDNDILIEDSSFLRSYGTGLYLEDADGTTLRNIQIQTNDLRVTASGEAVSRDYNDYQQSYTMSGSGGALYIKNGNPTIDGVYVSANGTMDATMKLTKGYYYMYMYLNMFFPLVGIDSPDIKQVSNIHIRDSTVNFHVHYNLYNPTYYGGYWYLYTSMFATAVNVLNYGDVMVADCTATNVKVGSGYATYTTYQYVYGTNRYYPNKGMTLFGATIDKTFSTAGPHYHKFTLANMAFEDVGVLTSSVSPNYNGTVAPTFYVDIIIRNVTVNKGRAPFFFGVGPQFSMMKTFYHKVHIVNSTFTNMTGTLHTESLSAGPGVSQNVHSFDIYHHILVENNLFRWNRVGTQGFFYKPSAYSQQFNNVWDTHIDLKDNKFYDNTGYFMYYWGNYYLQGGNERVTFNGNHIRNQSNANYFAYIYYTDRFSFINNLMEDCINSYGFYIIDYGGDYNGKKLDKFIISNNTFRNTYSTSNSYSSKGLFRMYWGGDLEFTNNNVTDVENCVLNAYEYTYYSGYAKLVFSNNEMFENNGTLLYHYGYSQPREDLTCLIENNMVWDNNGWFTDYYDQYVTQYDFDATIYFRNNTVFRSPDKVLREYGKVIVTNNRFRGCGGYVIDLDYLGLNPPVVSNNDIRDCINVYYIGAKDKGILKMSLNIKDLSVDCTGNAFYFKNVDVTMENVTITNRTSIAIIADKANVDAMGSTIPIGSGRTIGDGSITVWFEIEAFVEWANATAPNVSSGVRVSEALVVLYGATGAYFSSEYTDTNGHLLRTRIPQWSMKGSFKTIWTPYKMNVAKLGVTSSLNFDLDHDYVDEDALEFLLSDTYIPVVRITSPFPGDLFSATDVPLRGFTTEVGSGIGQAWIRITGGDWCETVVDENGDFSFLFTDLPEGDNVVITARVSDRALNFNETSVTISVDRTPPTLVVSHPEDGVVVNEQKIMILGTYEPGARISINGLERKGNSTSGTLSEEYILSEGNNTIVIEATDLAGNSFTVTRSVRLDRFAPTLTVLAPRDGLVTSVTNISVDGDAEEGSEIFVTVQRPSTTLTDERITPRMDGTFTHKVDLEEGQNVIVVWSRDSAENLAQVTRVVYVDTSAPLCTITSPEDGFVTNENTVQVLGTAEVEGVTLFLNGKQIFNSGTVDRVVNLNEGDNVIELRAVDVIGNEYRHRVNVVLDTKAPVIQMERPVADFILTNDMNLLVKGIIINGTSLTIMGNAVSLGANGAFETTAVLPEEGLNEVLLVARDIAGNMATHIINVDYSTMLPMLNIVFTPLLTNIEGDDANFYIYGTTTPGIRDVSITHTAAGEAETNSYAVGEDGSFSVVRTLIDGQNVFTIMAKDSHGNMNETSAYTVNYKYIAPDDEKKVDEPTDPVAISTIFLAVSVALIATAIVVGRSFRSRD